MSSSVCTNLNDSARQSPGQVPLVRATSPGAEFREERLLAAARKDRQDKIKVHPNASLQTPAATPDHFTYFPGGLSPHNVTTSLRRFHISRPSTSIDCLKATGAGIQKKRDGIPARVILVEKLNRTPLSRRVSNLESLIKAAESPSVSTGTQTELTGGDGKQLPEPKPQLRKRPIINSAEKRWREQQKATISAAKARLLSSYNEEAEISLDDSDDGREKLAREFEQIALELRHPDIEMKQAESIQVSDLSASEEGLPVNPPPKYRPRPLASNKRGNLISTAQTRTENLMEDKAYESQDAMQMDPPNSSHDIKQDYENSGKEYVYDIYVRRPLHVGQTFSNPLAGIEAGNRQTGIDTTRTGIGVVVITQEEEELWAPFVEEDEEEDQWDNADDDSNGKYFSLLEFLSSNKASRLIFYHISVKEKSSSVRRIALYVRRLLLTNRRSQLRITQPMITLTKSFPLLMRMMTLPLFTASIEAVLPMTKNMAFTTKTTKTSLQILSDPDSRSQEMMIWST